MEANKEEQNPYGILGVIASIVFFVLCLLLGNQPSEKSSPATGTPNAAATVDAANFRILAEGGAKPLEESGILTDFTKETGIPLNIQYGGPVEIRNAILDINNKKTPKKEVDAYWPGSSIWLTGSTTVSPETVMKTYVVLAVEQDTAKELGWDPAEGITVPDLVQAIQARKIQLAMTSASQSTPGAAFYLASYTALNSKPVLTSPDLENAALMGQIEPLFKGIERTGKDLDVLEQNYIEDKTSGAHKLNAIVIYESLAIDMNTKLVAAGQKPTVVFYLDGATAIAEAQIRYVDRKNENKQAQYEHLVAFLRRPDIQTRVRALGWRTNPIGMRCDECSESVFKPEWGIDTKTERPEMIFPKPPVIEKALAWYQAHIRKPSYTAYCLDYSGSMEARGREQVVNAMDMLLDQQRATEVLLQASPDDVTVVYGFSSDVRQIGSVVRGNRQEPLKQLSHQIADFHLAQGTAMFNCVQSALTSLGAAPDDKWAYLVIALTDGQSNEGAIVADFETFYTKGGHDTPVCGIAFGAADFTQLEVFRKLGGNYYDGREDPAQAFLDCKGNN